MMAAFIEIPEIQPLLHTLWVILWKRGAVKIGEFLLKLHEKFPDAPKSPIYLNLRTTDNPKPGPLLQSDLRLAAELMSKMAICTYLNFTHVLGIPNAGAPFADALVRYRREAHRDMLELLTLNKEATSEGRRVGHLLSGSWHTGDRVLLVDDLITQAHTKFEAVKSVQAFCLRVAGLLVLVDREQGGAGQMRKAGIPFVSVCTLSDMLNFYVREGYMKEAERQRVVRGLAELDAYVREHAEA
jgi:orotate phosphoribosyltransferase